MSSKTEGTKKTKILAIGDEYNRIFVILCFNFILKGIIFKWDILGFVHTDLMASYNSNLC